MDGCWEWLKSATYENSIRRSMHENPLHAIGLKGGTRKRKPISLRRTRRR